MKTFSNIYRSTFCWGRWFEYILYPIYFLLLPTSFIYIIIFFITITIKWCFVDIVDDEGYFEFLPEVEFTSPLQLTQNRRALHNCYSVKVLCYLLQSEKM